MKAKTLYILIATGLILMGGIVVWLAYTFISMPIHEGKLSNIEESQHHSVGSVASIQGKVIATSTMGKERILGMSDPIFPGDTIVSETGGRIQITFSDNSVISQGENSEMTIDEYVYSETSAKDSRFGMGLAKGMFRLVTGKIADLNPDRFKVKTKMATIGIRGCVLAFNIRPDSEDVYVIDLPKGDSVIVQKHGTKADKIMSVFTPNIVILIRPDSILKERPFSTDEKNKISKEATPESAGNKRDTGEKPDSLPDKKFAEPIKKESIGKVLSMSKRSASVDSAERLRWLETGSAIRSNERIETGPGSKLRIRLNDGTIIFLGEQSAILINSSRIKTEDGETLALEIKFIKGICRVIAGKPGVSDPDRIVILTRMSTILAGCADSVIESIYGDENIYILNLAKDRSVPVQATNNGLFVRNIVTGKIYPIDSGNDFSTDIKEKLSFIALARNETPRTGIITPDKVATIEERLLGKQDADSNVKLAKTSLLFPLSSDGTLTGNTKLNLVNSSVSPFANSLDALPVTSYYFDNISMLRNTSESPILAKAFFSDVYSDVDLAVFGNENEAEYLFIIGSEGSYTDVAMSVSDVDRIAVSDLGNVLYDVGDSRITQTKPYALLVNGDTVDVLEVNYVFSDNGKITHMELGNTIDTIGISELAVNPITGDAINVADLEPGTTLVSILHLYEPTGAQTTDTRTYWEPIVERSTDFISASATVNLESEFTGTIVFDVVSANTDSRGIPTPDGVVYSEDSSETTSGTGDGTLTAESGGGGGHGGGESAVLPAIPPSGGGGGGGGGGGPVTLSYITITGPASVHENGGDQYTCTAHYSDGSSANITAVTSWSEDSAYTTINATGYLTTGNVPSDQPCIITADYGGLSDTHAVTITDTVLSYITITGPASVNENGGDQYTCTAYYSDGSSVNVTASTAWSENSAYATINATGYLTTGEVPSNQGCTITANYGGENDTHAVTINNVIPPLAVNLAFVPNTVPSGDTSMLISTVTGGQGPYTYAYQFKYEHHVWDPTYWVTSSFTTPTNGPLEIYQSIRYRVTVTDSLGTSLLSNEALLTIVPSGVPIPPATRTDPL